MKTVIGFVVCLLLIGCVPENSDQKERREVVENFFAGAHPIHRMMPGTSEKSSIGFGGLFLFGTGGVGGSGSSESSPSVTFAWKPDSASSFIITTLPLKKVRIQFGDSTQQPTILFRLVDLKGLHKWNEYGRWKAVTGQSEEGPETILEDCLVYATILVRPADWPTQIQMPL